MPIEERQLENNTTDPVQPIQVKRFSFFKFIKRLFIFIFIVTILFISGTFILIRYYENDVKAYIISELNKQLNTRVIITPNNINLTLIKSFPYASLEFRNVKMLGTNIQYRKDTLLNAQLISLQFNVVDLFNKKYHIKKIVIQNTVLEVNIDKNGVDNYHFWKRNSDTTVSSNLTFTLEKITINGLHVKYTDQKKLQSDDITILKGYLTGSFSDSNFNLGTNLSMLVHKVQSENAIYVKEREVNLQTEIYADKLSKTYTIKTGKLNISQLGFNVSGKVVALDSINSIDLSLKGKDLDIQSFLSLVPEKYKDQLTEYSSYGNFYFDVDIKGNYGGKSKPSFSARFGINEGTVNHAKSDITFKDVTLQGSINEKNGYTLIVDKLHSRLSEGDLDASLSITKFSDPYLILKASATINLERLQKFIQIDTLESIEGKAVTDFSYNGKIPQRNNGKFNIEEIRNIKTGGNLELTNVNVRLKNSPLEFTNFKGSFLFDNSYILINSFCGNVSSSDFQLKGLFKNIIPYLLAENEVLTVDAKLISTNINLNELLIDEDKTTKKNTVYKVDLSDKINLNLNCDVKQLNFRKFEATNIKGTAYLHNKKLSLDPISFNTLDGRIVGQASLQTINDKTLGIYNNTTLEHVNINKMFVAFENFGQTTMTDKNIKGFLTANVKYESEWSTALDPDMDKQHVIADIKIEKGELIKYEPMKALSKYIKVEELENIKFATLENQIEINHQTILIPKTDIKSNALNISCSGKHTFNNEIDYHFKILLRELLAKKAAKAKKENEEFGEVEDDGLSRSIFISMTGTVDNPTIKYDRKSAFQKIKEDLKNEKQNFKQMLRNEFGWFKKDSTLKIEPDKPKQKKSKIKWDEEEKEDKKKDEDF